MERDDRRRRDDHLHVPRDPVEWGILVLLGLHAVPLDAAAVAGAIVELVHAAGV